MGGGIANELYECVYFKRGTRMCLSDLSLSLDLSIAMHFIKNYQYQESSEKGCDFSHYPSCISTYTYRNPNFNNVTAA